MRSLQRVREEYAQNTLALSLGLERPGAPALFDAAVTNGLVAIVAHEWPGEEVAPNSNGYMRPASALLNLIGSKAAGDAEISSAAKRIAGEVDVLRKAVKDLAPVRHGRGGWAFVHPSAVHALRELDRHPALSVLSSYEADDHEAQDLARDADARAFAETYLTLLSEEEVARRVADLDEALPSHLKERASGFNPQECDVCQNDTLVVSSIDPYGVGVGIGVCFVCGYQRGEAAARLEAQHLIYVADETQTPVSELAPRQRNL
ncbi:hypothetical protein GKC29_05710 [Micromonospora sp. WMMC415]|uniref:hypothetical protein n=1 Tax=Micromonospora sp. WMMC415 TaxID=2675222 RepID=UPI0012B4AF5C|nr:hypothetical protein [Micromonospora sp. WMMC415]QGN46377.1 hypothetical protein GKC29_05710 [Micromonospora sp. WMMC415]